MTSLFKVFFAAVLLLFTVSACTPVQNTRGNLISETRFEKVQPQVTNRYELRQILGPPSAVSPFSEGERWYYIGQKTEVMGVFKKEVIERRVVKVDFNKSGIVEKIEDVNTSEVAEVKPVKRTTPTAGKDFTVLQQFVGNLGRFNSPSSAVNK